MSRQPISVVGGTGIGLLFRMTDLPKDGQTVLATDMTYIDGGKAAGQAMAIARLAEPVELISAIGDDPLGDRLHAWLVRENVGRTGLARMPDQASMLAAVEVGAGGENRIVVALNAMAAVDAEMIRRTASVIAGSSLCLVSLEVSIEAASEALAVAREAGVTTVLNPAPAPSREDAVRLIPLSDVVTPNETEAAAMVGLDGTPEELAGALLAMGAGSVALTLGASGVLVADREMVQRIPAPVVRPEDIVDTTGAGDGFNAAMCVALARGHGLRDACRYGVQGGSLIVQGEGIVAALDRWRGFTIDIMDGSEG